MRSPGPIRAPLSVYERRKRDVTRSEQPTALDLALAEQKREAPFSILDWLFPYRCWSCGHEPVTDPLGLCLPCRARMLASPSPCCTLCARPFESDGLSTTPVPQPRICPPCSTRTRPFRRLVTAIDYRPPVDSVLAAFKFQRQTFLARPLARLAWDLRAELLAGHQYIVPVPLHWTRQLRRGFNQAEALAAELARLLDSPLLCALEKKRRGIQSRTPFEERHRNVRGAFGIRRRCRTRLRDKRVLLVDDVTTTGATLDAAAHLLIRAGASSVTAFALLRTPDPREGRPSFD